MTSSSDTLAANPTRELAAIMFSDIVGYTALMGRDEREGLRAVRDHRAHLRAVLPRFNGRLIGEIGDGTLSSFHSAVDAVNCARELQAKLVEDPELRLRIGIHVGDVVFTDKTVLGDGVNIASRIHGSSISTPFLVVVIFWLTILFVSFGMFAPPNGTVVIAMVVSAISVAGAIFLILELDHPFSGLIQISSVPLERAMAVLGK